MKAHAQSAFTIIEILVASSLFMMLMGFAAFSFQRLNEGGRYAQKIIELHQRSDSIIRLMEDDMRQLQQNAALQIDVKSNPQTFTFMRQITNYEQQGFGGNDLVSSITGLGDEERHRADLIWVKWMWGNGNLSQAHSRSHFAFDGWTGDHRHTDNTKQYIKSVNFNTSGTAYYGIHRNGIPATPQRHFVSFYGNGTFKPVAADGSVSASPGDQIRVFKKVASGDFTGNNCKFFDELTSPWRVNNDYSHWYTTLVVGNDEMLSNEAFAVCNIDGKTFNKDRINLEGTSDEDGSGNFYYPDQTQTLFAGVEYMAVQLLKRDGTVIDNSDDDDTINDGANSIDIDGMASDASGVGINKRPTSMRVAFLIHSIDLNELDETDYDADGDVAEYFVQAVRDKVATELNATRQEDMASFKRHCQLLGATSVVVNYAIKLGL